MSDKPGEPLTAEQIAQEIADTTVQDSDVEYGAACIRAAHRALLAEVEAQRKRADENFASYDRVKQELSDRIAALEREEGS